MLREDIQNAIKEAMKNHETERLSTVRMVLAGVKEKDVDARGKGKECGERGSGNFRNSGIFAQADERVRSGRSRPRGDCRNRRRLDEGHGEGDGRLKGKICRADGFRCGFRQNQGNAGLS